MARFRFPFTLEQARFVAAVVGVLVGYVAGPVVNQVSIEFQIFPNVPLKTDAIEIVGDKLSGQASGKHEVVFAERGFVGNGRGEDSGIQPGFTGNAETDAGFHQQAGFGIGVIGLHVGAECGNDPGADFFGRVAEIEVGKVNSGLVGDGVVDEVGQCIHGFSRIPEEGAYVGVDVGLDLDFAESLSAGGVFHHAGVGLGLGLEGEPNGWKQEKQKSEGLAHGRRK